MTECWWPRGCRRWGEGQRSCRSSWAGAPSSGLSARKDGGRSAPAPSRLGLAAQDDLREQGREGLPAARQGRRGRWGGRCHPGSAVDGPHPARFRRACHMAAVAHTSLSALGVERVSQAGDSTGTELSAPACSASLSGTSWRPPSPCIPGAPPGCPYLPPHKPPLQAAFEKQTLPWTVRTLAVSDAGGFLASLYLGDQADLTHLKSYCSRQSSRARLCL